MCTGCNECHGGLAMKDKNLPPGRPDTCPKPWTGSALAHRSHRPDSSDHGRSPAAFPAVPHSTRHPRSPLGHPQLQLLAWGSCGCGGGPVAPAAAAGGAGAVAAEPLLRAGRALCPGGPRARRRAGRGCAGSGSPARIPAVPQLSFLPLCLVTSHPLQQEG